MTSITKVIINVESNKYVFPDPLEGRSNLYSDKMLGDLYDFLRINNENTENMCFTYYEKEYSDINLTLQDLLNKHGRNHNQVMTLQLLPKNDNGSVKTLIYNTLKLI